MSARKPAAKVAAVKVAEHVPRRQVCQAGNEGGGKARRQSRPAKAQSAAGGAAAGNASATALALARDIDRAVNEGRTDLLSEAALQALMAAACRSYSAQVEAGGNFLPLAERCRVTSTDVMVTASGLLKAANLAVFELGMWQSWTGR